MVFVERDPSRDMTVYTTAAAAICYHSYSSSARDNDDDDDLSDEDIDDDDDDHYDYDGHRPACEAPACDDSAAATKKDHSKSSISC